MKVTVSTAQYQFAHGKSPRGHGNWAFFFDGEQDVMKAVFFTGPFNVVKVDAVQYAKAHGHQRVEVGS